MRQDKIEELFGKTFVYIYDWSDCKKGIYRASYGLDFRVKNLINICMPGHYT